MLLLSTSVCTQSGLRPAKEMFLLPIGKVGLTLEPILNLILYPKHVRDKENGLTTINSYI
jgi:hypothetical protein